MIITKKALIMTKQNLKNENQEDYVLKGIEKDNERIINRKEKNRYSKIKEGRKE